MQLDNFISWQVAKCGTSGFLTGLGGLITLPVAIPANIASVLLCTNENDRNLWL